MRPVGASLRTAGTALRSAIISVTSVLLAISGAAAPAMAQEPAPLIVAVTPSEAAGQATPTRAALERVARDRATAFIDLTPAAAQSPQAREHLRRGIEDYQAFKFPTALQHLEAGLAEAIQTGALGLSPSELSDLLIYRALVLTELGDASRAWDDFVRAVVLDPSRHLDAARFPPRATEPFSRAVEQVTTGPTAALTLAVPTTVPNAGPSPAGANPLQPRSCRILLDGRLAVSGQPQTVPWGEHYVHIECPDRQPHGAVVLIKEPERRIEPTLQPRSRPAVGDALAVARRQGASALIWAELTLPDGVTPTLALQLLDVASGKARRRASLRAGPGSENDIVAAVTRLLAADTLVTAPVQRGPQPWYRKPWFWGVVGASVATAVLLPFAIGGGESGNFDIRLRGDLP